MKSAPPTAFAAPLDIKFIGGLSGRYTFPGRAVHETAPSVFACRTQSVSPLSIGVTAPVYGELHEKVVAVFEHLGSVRGEVSRRIDGGFQFAVTATPEAAAALAARINWLKQRAKRAVSEKRVGERRRPKNPRAKLHFADGSIECFIIDVSLSGAGVSASARPPLGAAVKLGRVDGHVVRHFESGFGVQFEAQQGGSALEDDLIA